MPRNLPSPMLTGVQSSAIMPCILLDLTLASGVARVWSGVGSITWDGNTYTGLGDLGSIGEISESAEVRADGLTVTLSGINPALLSDCLDDIRQGAAAAVWIGLFSDGAIVSAYGAFVGTVDKPSLTIGPETMTIALELENKLVNLQRPSNRRYTMADQRNDYPDDNGFSWVEILNDIALLWG